MDAALRTPIRLLTNPAHHPRAVIPRGRVLGAPRSGVSGPRDLHLSRCPQPLALGRPGSGSTACQCPSPPPAPPPSPCHPERPRAWGPTQWGKRPEGPAFKRVPSHLAFGDPGGKHRVPMSIPPRPHHPRPVIPRGRVLGAPRSGVSGPRDLHLSAVPAATWPLGTAGEEAPRANVHPPRPHHPRPVIPRGRVLGAPRSGVSGPRDLHLSACPRHLAVGTGEREAPRANIHPPRPHSIRRTERPQRAGVPLRHLPAPLSSQREKNRPTTAKGEVREELRPYRHSDFEDLVRRPITTQQRSGSGHKPSPFRRDGVRVSWLTGWRLVADSLGGHKLLSPVEDLSPVADFESHSALKVAASRFDHPPSTHDRSGRLSLAPRTSLCHLSPLPANRSHI